jgi:hypothetical protein
MNEYISTYSQSSGTLNVLFKNPANAEAAYNDLLARGFTKDDISVVMSEDTHRNHFLNKDISETELKSKALEGVGIGGAVGGTLGAIAAAIAAVGTSLIIPGLGLVVAGSLAAGLAGAGAGAATGGAIGGLIGLGFPDEKAKEYEGGIKRGGVLLSVKTKSEPQYNELYDGWQIRWEQDSMD